MTALRKLSGNHGDSIFDVIGVPHACPLAFMPDGARWRRRLKDGGSLWLESADVGARVSSAIPQGSLQHPRDSSAAASSIDDWLVSGNLLDNPGSSGRVILSLPPVGYDEAGGFDWTIARQMLNHLSPNGMPLQDSQWTVRSEWMLLQAQRFCEELNLDGLQWNAAAPMQTQRYSSNVSGPRGQRRAILGYESAQGALWRLWGPRSLLVAWWRAWEEHAWHRICNGLPGGLLYQSTRLQLILQLQPLTPSLIARLEPVSVMRVTPALHAGALAAEVVLTTHKGYRFQPFHFSAVLDLHVRSDASQDRIELRWRHFMQPPEHHSTYSASTPSVTERITGQLTCVIADIDLSLEDLLHLQAGDLLPGVSISTPIVELRMGQQHVGTGELVRLGSELAVQLIEWNLSDNGGQAHGQSV